MNASPPNFQAGEARQNALFPLFLIFVLALAVRLVGLSWGLPDASRWYSYHPDESTRQIVGAVANLLGGDWNPHFFNYPSLSIYATWLFYQLLAGFGFATGAVSPQYPWPVVHDIILAGRLFSVGCGALTAPLVFLIARRLEMGKGAILAGILAALTPGHVQHSHFATVDVPATFFVVWCLYLTLRAENWKGLMGAALVAGLAAGTKYNAGLVLLAPLLRGFWLAQSARSGALERSDEAIPAVEAPVSSALGAPSERSRSTTRALSSLNETSQGAHFDRSDALSRPLDEVHPSGRGSLVLRFLTLILLALGAFLVSTPYALLAPREFWGEGENGFAFELLRHPKIGSGEIFQQTGNGWIYHLTFNLPFVLTWPLIFAALLGLGFTFKKREWWPLLAFLGLFFLSLGFSQVRFMRYLLPLAPVLALLAAYGASRLPQPKVWGAILGLFALWGTKDVLYPFVQTDPRDRAAQVLQRQRVALIGNPWFYTPPFQPQGFNLPVAGVEKWDGAKRNFPLAISEFEWREPLRLGRTDVPWLPMIRNDSVSFRKFKNRAPLALPGRDFVPHDSLYTNPETRIY